VPVPEGYDEATQTTSTLGICVRTKRSVPVPAGFNGYEGYEEAPQTPVPRAPQLPFIDTPLTLSKHYGSTPSQLIGRDDGYLVWLLKGNVLSESDKTNLATLLPRLAIQFGKYRGAKTFGWIKQNDYSYYRWVKENVREAYLQLW
jgi:hypothetical protein